MNKLELSIGILSWKSHKTLINTLESYKNSGLLDLANDSWVFFQEGTDEDKELASLYNLNIIMSNENVGIGKAFTRLAQLAMTENILLLENDWVSIENEDAVRKEILCGMTLLDNGRADVIKYRHRRFPGDPLYTRQFAGNEMASPKHLFECCHWVENPDMRFPQQISKDLETGMYLCDSKYANQTNNPCLFKTDFYLKNLAPFSGEGVDLETNIDGWWQEQNFTVAHGGGIFTHYRIDR